MALIPQQTGQHYRIGSIGAPGLSFPRSQKGQGWGDFASGLSTGLQNLAKGAAQERDRQQVADAIQKAEQGDFSKLAKYPSLYQQYKQAAIKKKTDYLDRAGKASKYLNQVFTTAASSKNPSVVLQMGVTNGKMQFQHPTDAQEFGAGAFDATFIGAMQELGIDPKSDNWAEAAAEKIKGFQKVEKPKKEDLGALYKPGVGSVEPRTQEEYDQYKSQGFTHVKPEKTKEEKEEKFGAPQKGIDTKTGKPTLFQVGDKGTIRPIQGMTYAEKGMKIQLADGTVIETNAPQGGLEPTKPMTTKIQEKLLNAGEAIARLNEVKASYDPKFLQYGTRLGILATNIKEKAGFQVAGEDLKVAEEYATFKRRAIENINRYIKEITGAQMSEAEANRLRQGMPDPGDSWYNGDSPTQFKAKLEDVLKTARMAKARYVYILKKGLATEEQIQAKGKNQEFWDKMGVSLDDMPSIINQKAEELKKKYGNDITGMWDELTKFFGGVAS